MLVALVLVVQTQAPVQAWLGEQPHRWDLDVQAPLGVPAGYSLSFTFDHAAEVAAGRSRADGSDVQLARWDGVRFVEVDRVLDTGSGWAKPDTRIWFSSPALPAGNDRFFALFMGNAATRPLDDPERVFLFHDGFESGSYLDKWWDLRFRYTAESLDVVDAGAHGGAYALRWRLTDANTSLIGRQLAIDGGFPDDVELEAWWRAESYRQLGFAFLLHFNAEVDNGLNFGPEDFAVPFGWRHGWREVGSYLRLAGAPTIQAEPMQWVRVTYAALGGGVRGCVDGVCDPLDGGFRDAGFRSDGGTVGLGRVHYGTPFPDGGRDVFLDDIRVRRIMQPEPVVKLKQVLGFMPADAGAADAGAVADAGSTVDAGSAAPDAGGQQQTPSRGLDVGCGCTSVDGLTMLAAAALLTGIRGRARRTRRTACRT